MDKDTLVNYLIGFGIPKESIKVYPNTGNVQISCLNAPWTHGSGTDSDPSCSISFKHDISLVLCWGCHFEGTLIEYISLHNQFVNGSAAKQVDLIRKLEEKTPDQQIDLALNKWDKKYTNFRESSERLEVWDDKELSAFKPILKKSFLEQKRIKAEIAQIYQLMWDEKGCRVVVPVRRWDGELVGCMGRCWCDLCRQGKEHVDKFRKKHFAYWNFPKSHFMFNEHLVSNKEKVFVVEGPFDVMRMFGAGFENTVALMGSSLSVDQARKLTNLGQPVVLMLDADPGGETGTAKAIPMLKGRVVSLHECTLPEGKDPGDLTDEEVKTAVENSKIIL